MNSVLRNLVIACLLLAAWPLSAQARVATCNNNSHCLEGWHCIGGKGGDNITPKGTCSPGVLLVQLCNLHAIVSGKIARLATLFVILWLGFRFFTAPREVGGVSFVPTVLAVVGMGLVFGSFQILGIMIGRYGSPCNFH